jgi:flagellar protein FlgJ
LLRSNPRYEKVLASAQDVHGFASGLQRAGYATDPDYAKKLSQIIRQNFSV